VPVAGQAGAFFAERLARIPLLAVLRAYGPGEAVAAAEACWAAGIDLVEVSFSHDREGEAVRAVCRRAQELGREAGAGTLVSPGQVDLALEAGAAFGVAPGLDAAVCEAARERGLPFLPGVATPSDVQRAVRLGYDLLKLFPAAELGPGWLAALHGPFPEVRFVAVGGIRASNAREFLDAGAAGVGVGSGLDPAGLNGLLAAVAR
jgi:Entner-Doudoroff aldolase